MIRAVGWAGVFFLVSWGAFGQQVYPAWFWAPVPPGWSVVFGHSDQEALKEASQVLTAYSRCEVLGNFQQLYDEAIDDGTWQNTDYHYVYDEPEALRLLKTLEVKDRYPVQLILGQNLYLVGPRGGKDPPDTQRVDVATLPVPDWAGIVQTFDSGSGRWRGVGRFTLQGDPADAWIKAEELGIFHMLQARLVQWGQTVRTTTLGSEDSTAHIEWIRLSYALSNVRIDGRWIDPETGLAMVAVSAPEAGIQEKQ